MNAWAERHRAALESALGVGETLRDADRVLLASTAVVDLAGPRVGQARRAGGRRGYGALRAARARGVDLPKTTFVLGLTSERLVVWRATTWLARPAGAVLSLPRGRVVSIRATGRFGRSRLRVLLEDGTLLVLRPYGGRRLDHLADDQ